MKLGRRGHTDVIAVEMYFLADNMFRMKIKPTEAARQRYEIPVGDVLVSQPAVQRWLLVVLSVLKYLFISVLVLNFLMIWHIPDVEGLRQLWMNYVIEEVWCRPSLSSLFFLCLSVHFNILTAIILTMLDGSGFCWS